MSALITFESIRPKYYTSDDDDTKVVITTLSAAIAFLVALEVRERIAFPGRQRDLSVLDRTMNPYPRSLTEIAKSRGYTGPESQGLSTSRVKLEERGDVLPPVTPMVYRKRRDAGLGPPVFPTFVNKRKLAGNDSQTGYSNQGSHQTRHSSQRLPLVSGFFAVVPVKPAPERPMSNPTPSWYADD